MEGFLIRLAIMHHENFTIDPNRDVWPFISKVFWKWVGSDSGEGDYLCMENMEDSIFDEKWIILEALPDSMLVRLLPYDDAFLSYAFQVMEIHTKSGIIIRTPEEMVRYFVPDYNLALDKEHMRKYKNGSFA